MKVDPRASPQLLLIKNRNAGNSSSSKARNSDAVRVSLSDGSAIEVDATGAFRTAMTVSSIDAVTGDQARSSPDLRIAEALQEDRAILGALLREQRS